MSQPILYNPIWLNRYTEYGIILGFGIWRIVAEKNSYTRKRLMILVFMVTVFWWMLPWVYPVYEPYVGFLWAQISVPTQWKTIQQQASRCLDCGHPGCINVLMY